MNDNRESPFPSMKDAVAASYLSLERELCDRDKPIDLNAARLRNVMAPSEAPVDTTQVSGETDAFGCTEPRMRETRMRSSCGVASDVRSRGNRESTNASAAQALTA